MVNGKEDIMLSLKDYKTILEHYNIDYHGIPASQVREKAEKIVNSKLCQCIKKVKKNMKLDNERPAIAICSKSILKNRNLKYYGFRCGKEGPRSFLNYYANTKDDSKRVADYKLTKQHRGNVVYKMKKTQKKKRRRKNKTMKK